MYLASRSPQRKTLLESLGIEFEIVLPEYGEVDPPGLSPDQLVERHSRGKAYSVLPRVIPLQASRPILGVDTMVFAGGRALGKAADEEQALEYLRMLSGAVHHVYSGITLVWAAADDGTDSAGDGYTGGRSGADGAGGSGESAIDIPVGRLPEGCSPLDMDQACGQSGLYSYTSHTLTGVRFAVLPEEEMDAYIATGEWRGRAGAYAIQERASAFVEGIEGDYTNVVGLPVPLLVRVLRAIGSWPPASWPPRSWNDENDGVDGGPHG